MTHSFIEEYRLINDLIAQSAHRDPSIKHLITTAGVDYRVVNSTLS